MVGQILDPVKEIQDDHKKARDDYFDFLQAVDNHNASRAKEIFHILDVVMGAHWKWEEESLYESVKQQLSEDLYNSLIKEHDECIVVMSKLAAIFKKWRLSDKDWAEARKVAMPIIYHIATCDGLPIMMERLGEEDMWNLRQAIFAARRENIPLLEWAEKQRKRKVEVIC